MSERLSRGNLFRLWFNLILGMTVRDGVRA